MKSPSKEYQVSFGCWARVVPQKSKKARQRYAPFLGFTVELLRVGKCNQRFRRWSNADVVRPARRRGGAPCWMREKICPAAAVVNEKRVGVGRFLSASHKLGGLRAARRSPFSLRRCRADVSSTKLQFPSLHCATASLISLASSARVAFSPNSHR